MFLLLFNLVACGINVEIIQNYETASAIVRQVALTTAAPPPLEVLSTSKSSSLSDPGEPPKLSISKRGRPYKREPIDGHPTKRSKSEPKSETKSSTEQYVPQQNTTSFRNAPFKQVRYLLAPMSRFGLYRATNQSNRTYQPVHECTYQSVYRFTKQLLIQSPNINIPHR